METGDTHGISVPGVHMKIFVGKLWIAIVGSGIGAAVVAFGVEKAWEAYQYRSIGPEYVDGTIRVDGGKVLIFVRNNSDEPLDLKRATISLDDPASSERSVGIYPEVSQIYTVAAASASTQIIGTGKRITVVINISQSIEPKGVDHFGISMQDALGFVDLSSVAIQADIEDLKGRRYLVNR